MKQYYFVFDVESIGLHGQAFSYGACVVNEEGHTNHWSAAHCPQSAAYGHSSADRKWVKANTSTWEHSEEVLNPGDLREEFWELWLEAKEAFPGILMAAEVPWPVETNFLSDIIMDDPEDRQGKAPYPLIDIASVMLAAGMDPMATYPRTESELPAHEPLADALQSARLLITALKKIHDNNVIQEST